MPSLLVSHLDWLVTVDEHDVTFQDAAIVVIDGRIEDLGPSAEVLSRHPHADRHLEGGDVLPLPAS